MENPQIEIGYGTPQGNADIYVNTFQATSHSELQWKEKTLADSVSRRVIRLPIYIKAQTEWRATPVDIARYFGFPVFTNLFTLVLSTQDGDVVRQADISPVFLTLIKNGEINLQPGETAYAHVRLALFDLASLSNQDLFATLSLDARTKYPGVFATHFSFWKIGTHSVVDTANP